jgi:DNA-binding transcriptional regulator LsrR (DeoR family)
MPEGVTSDQVVEAARELGQEEFTRGELAEKLGVPKPRIRKGFREARKSGRLEKVRDDEENTGYFRLTGE